MFSLARNICPASRFAARNKHTLPKMDYDYGAFDSIICKEIMELHHKKHHQTYINNLNAAEEQLKEAIAKNNVTKIISLAGALRFNGGGHTNHSIFWKNLTPKSTKPSKELKDAIEEEFCSMDNFTKEMSAATVAIQGSGWGWLCSDKTCTSRLKIVVTGNQDPVQAVTGHIPLFGIDVWEHAYYLHYKNDRATYVKNIFQILNWDYISKEYKKAVSGKG